MKEKIKQGLLLIIAQIPMCFFVLLCINEEFWIMAQIIIIVDMFSCWGCAIDMTKTLNF